MILEPSILLMLGLYDIMLQKLDVDFSKIIYKVVSKLRGRPLQGAFFVVNIEAVFRKVSFELVKCQVMRR